MNCKEFEKQILLFNELTSEDQTKLATHLATCKGCSILFESVGHTNNLITRVSKVNLEIEDPIRLTNEIMTRIKDEETKWWTHFEVTFPKLGLSYLKYSMATLSLLLIIGFGLEQSKLPITRELISINEIKKVVLNRKSFQEELNKSKASSNLSFANNCKSPFNITKVNEDCLKQRMASK